MAQSFAEAAGLTRTNHVLHRMPINPLDKCTLVSVYPKKIAEKKHTVFPGNFNIPAAPPDDISILVIGPSSWWREIDAEQPPIEIPTSSIVMAQSVIKDYCNGLVGCDMADLMPGLFFVPGPSDNKFADEYSARDYELLKIGIKTNHKVLIDAARAKQRNWFAELVRLADIDWARTNGNPISISDDARLAAEHLGMKNKPWMQDFSTLEMKNCPACGALRNPSYPICGSCKTIVDAIKYKELGLEQAKA